MKLELEMKTALPKIRAAFDAGKLQAQQPEHRSVGLYTGPCAIGVCIPEDAREALDHSTGAGGYPSVTQLIEHGVLLAPETQRRDFCRLQDLHDNALDHGSLDSFASVLTELEAKYALPA